MFVVVWNILGSFMLDAQTMRNRFAPLFGSITGKTLKRCDCENDKPRTVAHRLISQVELHALPPLTMRIGPSDGVGWMAAPITGCIPPVRLFSMCNYASLFSLHL